MNNNNNNNIVLYVYYMYVMQKRLYLPVFTVKFFVLFGMFINNTRFSMACIVIREYMK